MHERSINCKSELLLALRVNLGRLLLARLVAAFRKRALQAVFGSVPQSANVARHQPRKQRQKALQLDVRLGSARAASAVEPVRSRNSRTVYSMVVDPGVAPSENTIASSALTELLSPVTATLFVGSQSFTV